MREDLLFALRRLKKSPGFAAVAILSLALGIGATTAIFSILNGVLLRNLPFKDPDRVVSLLTIGKGPFSHFHSPVNFQDYASHSGIFQSAAAISSETFNVTGFGEPIHVNAAVVSWNFFQMLGSNPFIGRPFEQQESVFGKHRVAILSYRFWKMHFNADSKALGKTISVDGHPYIIVGVARRDVNLPAATDIWRPLAFQASDLDPTQRGARWIEVIGRLKDGLTLEQAQKQVAAYATRLAAAYPRTERNLSATVVPLREDMVKNVRTALFILFGAVAFVLLIACANVIHLLLAQMVQREGEVAVRTALGANRRHLIRQFVSESVVLTLIGGLLGFLVAGWGQDFLLSLAPQDIPRLEEIRIDLVVFFFALGSAFLAGLVIGILPALHAGRIDISSRLKLAGPGAISGNLRWRRALVATEVALSVVLLAGAGLLIRSFLELQKVDPGFQPQGLLTFNITLPDTKYQTPQQVSAFFDRLAERLRSHPQISSASAVFGLPFTTRFTGHTTFEIIGKMATDREPRGAIRVTTPDYFRTMKIPLRAGRFFSSTDTADSTPVAIINEAASRTYWPNENPIGQKIQVHASLSGGAREVREIVGIVDNVRYEALDLSPEAELYIPHPQQPVSMMTVVLRSPAGISNAAAIARSELKRLDPDVPAWEMAGMNQLISDSVAKRRFLMILLAAFAGVALFLAALGLYGVLSYSITQRTKEIGLRVALGATNSDVFRLVFREAMFPLGAGIVGGIAGSFALTRVLAAQLFQVRPTDPFTFVVVLAALVVVAIFSSYFPFERAVRLSPMQVLRYE
jgi:putative ABC transport system permease protein